MKKSIGIKFNLVNFIERNSIAVAIFVSLIIEGLFYLGFIGNVRSIFSDVIAYLSILLGLLGVYLGIFVSLDDDSLVFKRLNELGKDNLKIYKNRLIKLTSNTIYESIFMVVFTLLLSIVNISLPTILKHLIFLFWVFILNHISIGTFLVIHLITGVANKNSNTQKKKKKMI